MATVLRVWLRVRLRILPYPLLISTLAVSSLSDLEDLIIDAIKLDILLGRLEQKKTRTGLHDGKLSRAGRSRLDVECNEQQVIPHSSSSPSPPSALLATLYSHLATLSSQSASIMEQ
ncbi:hypothetical protein EV361DRAFT_946860 [Lentinula raphanica]|nr:hypothetical protein EV361DRAFT_946860 [Lentinula raphanica]